MHTSSQFNIKRKLRMIKKIGSLIKVQQLKSTDKRMFEKEVVCIGITIKFIELKAQ